MKARGPKPGSFAPRVSLANATEAWGEAMPEWVRLLAQACDRTSQGSMAKRLGVSGSTISAVLRKNYTGSYEPIEIASRGVLMAETLICPVLGEIATNECLDNQKRSRHFSSGSSIRVRLYQACRGACAHSRIGNANHGE